MPNIPSTIAKARQATCAIMRISEVISPKDVKKHKRQAGWRVGFCGTGWCFVDRQYVATAYHIFNGGRTRDPSDKFFVFVVPNNGPVAYHTQVTGFPFESEALDLAILEIAPPASYQLTAIPVTFRPPPDGEHVVTYGFPAPQVAVAQVDAAGNWMGGNLFLKGHANEGIVSASYDYDSHPAYELNVGWHHGESGGPILTTDPIAVFAVMQAYRTIQGPHGMVAGPHMGRAVRNIEAMVRQLGASVISSDLSPN